jgi:hypothetical protein
MRRFIALMSFSAAFIMWAPVFALPPVVNYNVEVMQNATPAQCTDWRGQIAPEENAVAVSTPAGESTFGSPGIRSCTGCNVNASGACICNTCYDYTDGP